MEGLVISAIVLSIAFVALASKQSQAAASDIEDAPLKIDSVREGVEKGWYTAKLTVVDGIPAIRLTGKLTDGKTFTDVYRLNVNDWKELQKEGFEVVEEDA